MKEPGLQPYVPDVYLHRRSNIAAFPLGISKANGRLCLLRGRGHKLHMYLCETDEADGVTQYQTTDAGLQCAQCFVVALAEASS